MEKVKSRILIVILIFMALLVVWKSCSLAHTSITLGGHTFKTQDDLAAFVYQNKGWLLKLKKDDFKSAFKGTIGGGGAINYPSAACMYHKKSNQQLLGVEIAGVIIIDGDELGLCTIDKGKFVYDEVSLTDKQKKKVANMCYLTYEAQQKSNPGQEYGIYKDNFVSYFDGEFRYSFLDGYDGFKKFYTSIRDGNYSAPAVNAPLGGTALKKEKVVNSSNEVVSPKAITRKNGKRLLGPFKVSFSGYKMQKLKLTINGSESNVDKIWVYNSETDTYVKKNVDDIKTNKAFYIEVPKNIDDWKVELIPAVTKIDKYSATILLTSHIGNDNGQNVGIYDSAKKEIDVKSVTWDGNMPDNPPSDEYGSIVINKVTEGGGPLSGVEFTIKDLDSESGKTYITVNDKGEFEDYSYYNNTTVKFVTDDSGQIKVTKLPVGHRYQVQERNAPEDYELDEENIKQTKPLTEEGQELDFKFIDGVPEPPPQSDEVQIVVKKTDGTTEDPIKGVQFKLFIQYYSETGETLSNDTITLTTKANGKASTKLKLASEVAYIEYTITEVLAPAPYKIKENTSSSDTPVRLYRGSTEKIEIKNDGFGKLKFRKKNQHNNVLEGAKFNIAYVDENDSRHYITSVTSTEVKLDGGNPYVFTTDSDGEIKIENLPLYGADEATYVIEEISAPKGCNLDFQLQKEIFVQVSGDDDYTEIEMVNIETENTTIKKVDKDDGTTPLADVYFVLADERGRYLRINDASYLNGKITIKNYEDIEFVESSSDATTFITSSVGQTIIDNLPTGKYKFIEKSNQNYGYKHNANIEKDIEVKVGQSIINVENEQALGNLNICKIDKRAYEWSEYNKPQVPLEGVEFKIRISELLDSAAHESGNVYKYLQLSNSSGVVKEVNGVVKVNQHNNVTYGGEYQVKYVNRYEDSTTFITDKNGIIRVDNLEVYQKPNVKYTYYIDEVSMGNEWYMYYDVKTMDESEKDEDYLQLEKNFGGKTSDKLILNYQKYVDLSGYVWEDIQSGKDKMRNDLYKDDENDDADKRVTKDDLGGGKYKGITVNLLKKGEIIASAETDDKGEYFFPSQMKNVDSSKYSEIKWVHNDGYKIVIDELKDYSIEFWYNGLKYASVNLPDNLSEYWAKPNSSKAKDNEANRTSINNEFYAIKGGNVKDTDRTKTTIGSTNKEDPTKLIYTNGKDGERSSALVQNTKYTKESLKGSVDPEDRATVVASTTDSEYKIIFIPEDTRVRKTIENINLGIYERQQADLTVATDLEDIKLTINDYAHTYNYFKRKNYIDQAKFNEGDEGYDAMLDIFSVSAGNRYSDGYRKLSYVREIYPSYLAYTDMNKRDDKRLRVYVTYTVTIKNESSSLNNTVKLRNYCDPNYELIHVTIGDPKYDNDGNVSNDTVSNWELISEGQISTSNSTPKEKRYETKEDISVSARDFVTLKLIYELSTDAVCGLMKEELNTMTNTTEILSYTTSDYNGKYASIDRDSAPDNSEYGKEDTYEDDIDSAPDLKLKKSADEKTLTGTVFEDETEFKNKVKSDAEIDTFERLGNGSIDNGEKAVKNVKVELVKKNGERAQTYKIVDDNGMLKGDNSDALKDTSDKGKYEFVGLIPDIYYLKYTYGYGNDNNLGSITTTIDGKNIVPEEYKSTIVTDLNAQKLLTQQTDENAKDEDKYWIYSEFNDENIKNRENDTGYWYENFEVYEKYSASIDNYVHRKYINKELSNFGYNLKTNYDVGKSDNKKLNDDDKLYIMTAQTPMICIAIEERDKDTVEINNSNNDEYGHKIKSSYETVFGIARRPRQNFEVTKEISYVKVILANGQILLEGDPSKDEIGSYLTYPEGGRVKIEIDNEILQGATLEITYKIEVSNLSDRNYNTRGYYSFGTDLRDEVKTKIKLMDYLDKEISYYENNEWKVIKTDEVSSLDLSNNTKTMNSYNFIEQNGTIDLLPGEKGSIKIMASKILTTAKDIWYDNKVEFYNVENPVGRFYDKEDTPEHPNYDPQTPGNYGDNPDKQECDNNKDAIRAELMIVPPTGQTRIYYAVGIGCLILLIGGIVLIKKIVLK